MKNKRDRSEFGIVSNSGGFKKIVISLNGALSYSNHPIKITGTSLYVETLLIGQKTAVETGEVRNGLYLSFNDDSNTKILLRERMTFKNIEFDKIVLNSNSISGASDNIEVTFLIGQEGAEIVADPMPRAANNFYAYAAAGSYFPTTRIKYIRVATIGDIETTDYLGNTVTWLNCMPGEIFTDVQPVQITTNTTCALTIFYY